MSRPDSAQDAPSNLSDVVGALAGALMSGRGMLSEGDAAALRRMDPAHPNAPGFWKLLATVLAGQIPGGDVERQRDLEERWAAIVVGLAQLGDLNARGARFGRALAAAGLAEGRFVRLLNADRAQVLDEVVLVARFLAAKGVPADWTQAARLVLSLGGPDEETARRDVARDYYAALASN